MLLFQRSDECYVAVGARKAIMVQGDVPYGRVHSYPTRYCVEDSELKSIMLLLSKAKSKVGVEAVIAVIPK